MSANSEDLTANPNLLWSVDDLASRMDDPKLRIIDVRPGERFAMGHIEGARNFDIYALNCDDTDDAPLQSFVRMWAFLLGRRGVSPDDTLVFCGEVTGMTATRGFWFAEYLGHKTCTFSMAGTPPGRRPGVRPPAMRRPQAPRRINLTRSANASPPIAIC